MADSLLGIVLLGLLGALSSPTLQQLELFASAQSSSQVCQRSVLAIAQDNDHTMADSVQAVPAVKNQQTNDHPKQTDTESVDTVMKDDSSNSHADDTTKPADASKSTNGDANPTTNVEGEEGAKSETVKDDKHAKSDELRHRDWREKRDADDSDSKGGKSRFQHHRKDNYRDNRDRRDHRSRSRDRNDNHRNGRGGNRGYRGRGPINNRGRGGYYRQTEEQHNQRRANTKSNRFQAPESSDPEEIRDQVEFYFSDSNLAIDNFLLKHVDGSNNIPVPIKLIHNFTRMRRFQPYSAVVAALRDSKVLDVFPAAKDVVDPMDEDTVAGADESKEKDTADAATATETDATATTPAAENDATMTKSDAEDKSAAPTAEDKANTPTTDDKSKPSYTPSNLAGAETIARKTPLHADFSITNIASNTILLASQTLARSLYAKGFGAIGEESPTTQTEIEAFFAPFGPINAVRLRRNIEGLFKGSVFVEFADTEGRDQFLAMEKKPEWNGQALLKVETKDAYEVRKTEERRKRQEGKDKKQKERQRKEREVQKKRDARRGKGGAKEDKEAIQEGKDAIMEENNVRDEEPNEKKRGREEESDDDDGGERKKVKEDTVGGTMDMDVDTEAQVEKPSE